ncbi:TonB-dependent receptor [Sphingomonas sp. Leaf357]|uniref:TonB-dependent receptor n=1 Tax=Sphingomonas sp. Leaf357 TaxID=1736350 RepID=UPI0006F50C6F|nr:TonB-dependent receptor [Sphingomonas sp. Leaf357]KQS03015.1 TonB-dependent receptor [Sphingomonas sp. Leaf357]
MKALYLSGAALLASIAAPASAQVAAPPAGAPVTDPAADDATPGEIIVTAQKRSERLQDVPVAVSVVSGDALAAQGKVSLEGAQYLVPTLNFLKSGTTLNQSLFLRGVGTATFSIAGEPSVSTVVDGVVFARAGEAFGDLVDIDQLEVLRGPQGTLFGKNASAGVINIISKKPTRELGGYVEAGYFTKSEFRGRAVLNLPLGENVRSRVTGFYNSYDGNIYNTAVNKTVNGFKHYGGRLQIEADATPGLKLSFIADYHRNDDNCCAEVIATPPINTATGAATTNPSSAVLPTPYGDQTRQVAQNLVTATKETGYGFSLQGDLDIGDHTLTSITAYRDYKNTEIRDGDFLPNAYVGFNQLHDFGPQTGHTFSQEIRLASPAKQFVEYVVGAYYSRAVSERIFTRNDVVCNTNPGTTPSPLVPCGSTGAPATTFPTGTADFGSTFDNLAFFGQGTVNVAPRFRVIGGLRYSIDHLDVFHKRVTALAGPGINGNFDQGVFDTGVSNGVPFTAKTSNNNLSGKAGLQFDLSHDSTAYASYSRGYKGPAYNVFFNLTATGTNVIAPETSDAYEIGLKNTLAGGKLVLNLAAYYAKYHNFQANNPDLVAGVVVTRFTNAGEVSTRGVELDAIFRPARDFSLSGGVAYTDAKVDQFNAPAGAAVVPSGTPLGFAPKWKGNLSADYRWRTEGPVDLLLGAQGSYQSSELALFAADAVQRRLGTIKGYGLVNLSAGVTSQDDRYRLTFQVRNLFDQSFAASIINGGPGQAYRYQIPRDADRYYGVTGRVTF